MDNQPPISLPLFQARAWSNGNGHHGQNHGGHHAAHPPAHGHAHPHAQQIYAAYAAQQHNNRLASLKSDVKQENAVNGANNGNNHW